MGRARRIRRGFHRLGVLLASVPLLFLAGGVYYWARSGYIDPSAVVRLLAAAALAYAFPVAVGWVVTGFMREDGER